MSHSHKHSKKWMNFLICILSTSSFFILIPIHLPNWVDTRWHRKKKFSSSQCDWYIKMKKRVLYIASAKNIWIEGNFWKLQLLLNWNHVTFTQIHMNWNEKKKSFYFYCRSCVCIYTKISLYLCSIVCRTALQCLNNICD